jgi:hypothetical protein
MDCHPHPSRICLTVRLVARSRERAPGPVETRSRPHRGQTGMVSTVVLFLIVSISISMFLAIASPQSRAREFDRVTQQALAEATRALIGRAAMDQNRPGSLPCPDTNNDGIAELLVGPHCPKNLGRLPWRTLGLPALADASGEVLWYALSPSLRDHASAQPINSDTAGDLNVSGTMTAPGLAAVVIAPGRALNEQVRNKANENDPAHYLEGENASFETSPSLNLEFQIVAASEAFNDGVQPISRQHLFNAVEWRVANEIRTVLRRYYTTNGYFPYANDYASGSTGPFNCKPGEMRGRLPNPDLPDISATCPGHADWGAGLSVTPPPWFFANGWHLLTYYAPAPGCTHPAKACSGTGLLMVNNANNRHAVVIVGSGAIAAFGQRRPCISQADCIEQPAAAMDRYLRQSITTTFNDKVAVLP